MAGLVAVIYGIVAYGFTLVALLYLIGFVGNLIVPKSIDSGTAGPLLQSVIVDTMLIGLFAIQHSVMARPGFKRWWTRIVPPSVERSTYVLFASFALLILYWQWQPIPALVWTVHNPTAAAVLDGIFWLGWVVLVASTFLLSHFELFGLSQVFARLFGKQLSDAKFRAPLLYRHVRHPIYLGVLLAVWATPAMTVGHLLFCGGDHRLHPDRHPVGRARSDPAVRRPVSPLPPARGHARSRFRAASSPVRKTPTSSAGCVLRQINEPARQGMDMKTPGTNYFMLRVALLIAPFGIVDGANAACAPASPANNVAVDARPRHQSGETAPTKPSSALFALSSR